MMDMSRRVRMHWHVQRAQMKSQALGFKKTAAELKRITGTMPRRTGGAGRYGAFLFEGSLTRVHEHLHADSQNARMQINHAKGESFAREFQYLIEVRPEMSTRETGAYPRGEAVSRIRPAMVLWSISVLAGSICGFIAGELAKKQVDDTILLMGLGSGIVGVFLSIFTTPARENIVYRYTPDQFEVLLERNVLQINMHLARVFELSQNAEVRGRTAEK